MNKSNHEYEWTADWGSMATGGVVNRLVDQYRNLHTFRKEADPDELEKFESYDVPFQFTLLILAALYSDILHLPAKALPMEASQPLILGARTVTTITRAEAMEKPLRAVGYFSWERQTRMFLVRRIFPPFFDYLSTSHVPEGWGASSKMLYELREELKKGRPVSNGSFYTVFNPDDDRRLALPYIVERGRLNYHQILVAPVFDPSPNDPSHPELLGAFLFFWGVTDVIPKWNQSTATGLRQFLEPLCQGTGKIVKLHYQYLEYPDHVRVASEWEKIRTGSHGGITEIIKVELTAATKWDADTAATELVSHLSGTDFYAVLADSTEIHSRTVLIAARHEINLAEFHSRVVDVLVRRIRNQGLHCRIILGSGLGAEFTLTMDIP